MNEVMPVISHWGNGWHGLDALTNIWNVILGLAVFFLARVLGALYFINNIADKELVLQMSSFVVANTVLFLVFFLAFVILHFAGRWICCQSGNKRDLHGAL